MNEMDRGMRSWNVRVIRGGHAIHIGQVTESSEALARCAALSRYGISENEIEAKNGHLRAAIYPDEEFDASAAL